MLSNLKDHPFGVEALFESSIVLTFAFPKEELTRMIPDCLTLDTYQDKWAFIAIAIVKTKHLRPKGFPQSLGNDFILIGYRIFVKYLSTSGKRLRGLYILKSETNKKKMEILGNVFTHYQYTTTDIDYKEVDNKYSISSKKSGLSINLELNDPQIQLPQNSPFIDWKAARRFAGPLPFTFTFNDQRKRVLIIEGIREHWTPQLIKVKDFRLPYFDEIGLKNGQLANAFIISQIPYYWKKGRTESWKP